jgi:hypothetical protein
LFRDNVPTVELAVWGLEATLFDGEIAAGPVPVLFSEEPEATLVAVTARPTMIYRRWPAAS